MDRGSRTATEGAGFHLPPAPSRMDSTLPSDGLEAVRCPRTNHSSEKKTLPGLANNEGISRLASSRSGRDLTSPGIAEGRGCLHRETEMSPDLDWPPCSNLQYRQNTPNRAMIQAVFLRVFRGRERSQAKSHQLGTTCGTIKAVGALILPTFGAKLRIEASDRAPAEQPPALRIRSEPPLATAALPSPRRALPCRGALPNPAAWPAVDRLR